MIPNRGFPESEFAARTELLQQRMEQHNIDLVLLTTEADVRYYSGFLTQFWQSPTRPWFLCIPSKGKPIAVIPGIGAACMANTWIEDIRTWPSPIPSDDGIGLLTDTIKELTNSNATVGTPLCRETYLRLPVSEYEKLKNNLLGYSFVDAGALVIEQRRIKSELEIEKLKYICTIASNAFAELPSIIELGLTEVEIFKRFKIKCLEAGVDDTPYLVGGAASGGYGDIISPPSNRALALGDVLILDTGCVWDGYFCDFDRNFLIGGDSSSLNIAKDAMQAHQIVWDATEAGLQAVKPGITCCELFKVMQDVMTPFAVSGGGDVGRLGHGLGMQLTEPPSLTSFDQTVLEPGMVLTLEPGYTFAPGKMMVHEENIVVRDHGAELVSVRAPRDLAVLN